MIVTSYRPKIYCTSSIICKTALFIYSFKFSLWNHSLLGKTILDIEGGITGEFQCFNVISDTKHDAAETCKRVSSPKNENSVINYSPS